MATTFWGGIWSNRYGTYLTTNNLRLLGRFGLLLPKLATTYSRWLEMRLMACLPGQGDASILEYMCLKINKWLLKYTNCNCCLTSWVNEIILEVTCVFSFNFLCPEFLFNWFKGNCGENSRKHCNIKADCSLDLTQHQMLCWSTW